jgi:hypothetical protein
MGQFFTNVQVWREKSDQALDRNELASRIVSALAAEGFREVFAPGEGNRRIHVGGASEGGWLTVLDSATEGQDPARLDQTAAMVSTVAESAAISILVHDGDRLQLALFREGHKRASFDSWPGYFAGEPPSASASGLEAWVEVLPPGRSVDDLRLAWTPGRLDEGALPRLKRMAQVLGLDVDQCALGANSLPPTMQPDFTTMILDGELPVSDRVGPNLPALGHTGGIESAISLRVNQSRRLTMIAHSTSAPGSGLRATVWGSALESGLISVVRSSLSIGAPEDAKAIELRLDKQATSSGMALMAAADDLVIPAGYASPGDAFAAARGDIVYGMACWMATRINFDLNLVGVDPGAGVLHVCLEPMANPDGQAIWTTQVRVHPAA